MKMKRTGAVSLLFALLAGTVVVVPADAAKRKPAGTARGSLDKRPFTVVAVVDTGINPYHIDFRAPELSQHPSTYITGFPRTAKPLRLSLGASSYEDAVTSDKSKWNAVKRDQLHWIPGTNIVGAIGPLDGSGGTFLDQKGHGTATASLAGGRVHGPKTNDIVIVVVRGDGGGTGYLEELEWAARQPWIDVVTNSWAEVWSDSQLNERVAQASRAAVEAGKLVCFGSFNTAGPFWAAGSQGPSWIVSVGAASKTTRGEHVYTSWPNDVLGFSGVQTANYQSIRDENPFSIGTSFAAPNVCGEAARVISEIRGALGDHREGAGDDLARGRKAKGEYLKDGCLDRVELEDALHSTAVPAETSPPDPDDPLAIPAAPVVGFVRGGYGIVDHDSAQAAIDVLLGGSPRPERALEDAWITHIDSIRDEKWGPPPAPVGCR